MKIGLGKRILMFLHWLFSLLICAALVLSVFFPYVLTAIKNAFINFLGVYGSAGLVIAGAVFGALYAILCIVQLSIIFRRRAPRSERGFITVDSSDNSRVRIAIAAIEQMVRQSVYNIDGISDMKIAIENADDAIEIKINASILAGSHVPTITLNMQQAIRKFVELNCGVAVRTVTVSINSVTSADPSARKKHRSLKPDKKIENVPAVDPEMDAAPVEPVVSETPVTVEETEVFEPSEMPEVTAPLCEEAAAIVEDMPCGNPVELDNVEVVPEEEDTDRQL